jgi:hypothetical protein
MRQNGFFGLFQRGDDLIPAYRGKVGEEFGQRLTLLKVVDQGLERNPGADEYRCPFEDFGVPCGLRSDVPLRCLLEALTLDSAPYILLILRGL